MTALMKDNDAYIEFLIKLGVDFTSLSFSQNKSIIDQALSYKSKKILTAIIQAPKININVNEIYTMKLGKKPLLHMAINMQNIKLVTSLLNHQDIDINIADDLGISPLMQAVIGSYEDKDTIIDLLLQRPEINLYQKNFFHENVLHCAVMYANNNKYIKIFTNAGLDINSQNKYQWTPLHLAIYNNHLNNVKTLLDLGADKNMLAKQLYRLDAHKPLTCLNLAKTEEMKNLLNN
jgi:ankyrin repeat protein